MLAIQIGTGIAVMVVFAVTVAQTDWLLEGWSIYNRRRKITELGITLALLYAGASAVISVVTTL